MGGHSSGGRDGHQQSPRLVLTLEVFEFGNAIGIAVEKLNYEYIMELYDAIPENTNFGVKTSVVRSILESSNVSSPPPNTSSISKTKLGKMISDGTYYLSCWMTTAQIEKMRSRKVIFQNLE